MTENQLEIRSLTHRYGKKAALSDVSLTLEKDKIYGLLGRNGAGKTTLINILLTGIFPTSGQVLLDGASVRERPGALKKLCVIKDQLGLLPSLSVRGAMEDCAKIYPNWDAEYAKKLLEVFELPPKKKYKQLSRGMESSLGLVIGLASRAELTVFDEPTLGLDAVARENFYDQLLHDHEEHPRTIIISTHLIDEVAKMFEEVIMIAGGRLLLQKPAEELLGEAVTLTGEKEAVERAAQGHRVLHRDELGGMTIVSILKDGQENFADVNAEPLPLQKLFVYLTEEGAEQ